MALRVRGGALAASPAAPAPSPSHIGSAAAALVQDGETVFIGPGPLALETAQALCSRLRLTVVTNSLDVAVQIAAHSAHTLIITGGQLERTVRGVTGQLARAALQELRADRVIVELNGVCAVSGLSGDSLAQAEIVRLLLRQPGQAIVLVAPQRVGRVAAVHIGPVSDADVIVTAREADSALLWDLSEAGVRVVLA